MSDNVVCPGGHENQPGAKFCNTCGEKIVIAVPGKCPGCGVENSSGAKFCNSCGNALGGGISAGGGVNLGDTGMIKDSTISSTTNIDNTEYKGAPAVGGSQILNIGTESSRETKTGEYCPICGVVAKDNYFRCKGCGRNYICREHQDKSKYVCEECLDATQREEAQKVEQERQEEEQKVEQERQNAEDEKMEKAEEYFKEAEVLLDKDKQSDAMELFHKTLELNPEHREARERLESNPQVTVNDKDGSEMIPIFAGEFLMGTNDYDEEKVEYDKPQHKVTLGAYHIGKYPVTVAQYKAFCKRTRRKMPKKPYWGWKDNHPVVNVSWDDAAAYCEWAGGRLPTEAEWEKAARGTDGRTYPWGEDVPNSDYANYNDMAGETTSVERYSQGASPYGVLGMAGNVWEWCSDWFDEGYYEDSPKCNPKGPSGGSYRVFRGGSWGDMPGHLRASLRSGQSPDVRGNSVGFRFAKTL